MTTLTVDDVAAAIGAVRDPEIPTVGIGDLGLVERMSVTPVAIEVDLLLTFVGCPALDVIKSDVERAIAPLAGEREVRVRFVMDIPWTTDRVTAAGREALSAFGISPPVLVQIAVPCPYCGSRDTTLESGFGPTACRTIRYCRSCKNPFEGFKTKRVDA